LNNFKGLQTSTKQLITQLQTRLRENKNQRDAILIATAVIAALMAATVILVLVWKKGFFHKSAANDGNSSPAMDEDQDATDNGTPKTRRPESRFVSPRLNLPSV
jgi:hypothetical protein